MKREKGFVSVFLLFFPTPPSFFLPLPFFCPLETVTAGATYWRLLHTIQRTSIRTFHQRLVHVLIVSTSTQNFEILEKNARPRAIVRKLEKKNSHSPLDVIAELYRDSWRVFLKMSTALIVNCQESAKDGMASKN